MSTNTLPRYPNVVKNTETDVTTPILDQIIGQTQAKRAITIALAGRHNILLCGPPGSGKSLLASTIPSLLPPPNDNEIVELTKLYSLVSDMTTPCANRPFRAPHHSASQASLLGGADGLPGEISLAHLGVLFLDELPEFRRDFLESLRQPLENHHITISRTKQHVKYPADFMLVATMNPCPCGYLGSNQKECTCPASDVQRYHNKLSGPLLDRIDIIVQVPKADTSVLVKTTTISTQQHASAKHQIQTALNTQFKRSHNYNARLSSSETIKCPLSTAAKTLLEKLSKQLNLSARTYFKTIKVAQTIADIDQSQLITDNHIAEALQYRPTF